MCTCAARNARVRACVPTHVAWVRQEDQRAVRGGPCLLRARAVRGGAKRTLVRPDRRGDVVRDGRARCRRRCVCECAEEPKVEALSVDCDEDVRLLVLDVRDSVAEPPAQAEEVREELKDAHHSQLRHVEDGLESLGAHRRTTDTTETHVDAVLLPHLGGPGSTGAIRAGTGEGHSGCWGGGAIMPVNVMLP